MKDDVELGKQVEPSYAQMRQFLVFYHDRYLKLATDNGEGDIISHLDVLAKKNARKAIAGLKQAINDCIEMSSHFSYSIVEELDTALSERRIVTLSELRRIYSKSYKKVLSRGYIKTETEFYLLRNILNDSSLKESSEVKMIEKILANYELT